MPLELKKYDENLNKSNYIEKVKQQLWKINKYIEENNINEWKKWNFAYFCFWVLTPAYEDFIQEYLKNERWIDLISEDIDADDKQIFPEWIKSWIKYFNKFINWIKNWTVNIQVNTWWRDFEKNINIFFSLPNSVKLDIFKMIYYGMYNFNSLSRNIRTTVKIDLDKLKNEIN